MIGEARRAATWRQDCLPLGTKVSQVRPASGSTWVKPVPAGGLGMRMRCWQAGHWIWRPA